MVSSIVALMHDSLARIKLGGKRLINMVIPRICGQQGKDISHFLISFVPELFLTCCEPIGSTRVIRSMVGQWLMIYMLWPLMIYMHIDINVVHFIHHKRLCKHST